jgi:hypothetical protein
MPGAIKKLVWMQLMSHRIVSLSTRSASRQNDGEDIDEEEEEEDEVDQSGRNKRANAWRPVSWLET